MQHGARLAIIGTTENADVAIGTFNKLVKWVLPPLIRAWDVVVPPRRLEDTDDNRAQSLGAFFWMVSD